MSFLTHLCLATVMQSDGWQLSLEVVTGRLHLLPPRLHHQYRHQTDFEPSRWVWPRWQKKKKIQKDCLMSQILLLANIKTKLSRNRAAECCCLVIQLVSESIARRADVQNLCVGGHKIERVNQDIKESNLANVDTVITHRHYQLG